MANKSIKELLAVVLGDERSANIAAEKISSLARFPVEEDFSGLISTKRAKKVMAMMEMNRTSILRDKKCIVCPEDFIHHLSWLRYEPQEHLVLLSMNSASEVVNQTVIFKGSVNETTYHPREIFRQAFMDNAVAIAIAHNHPSGNLDPSPEDNALTKVICAVGKIMRIPVLDHIIVSTKGIFSFCREHREYFEETLDYECTMK